MSIRPIDHLLMPPKSQEAATQNFANLQREQHAHESLFVQHQKDVKHNSEMTIKSEKSENNEYRYDAREKGNNEYSGKKKKKKKDSKGNSGLDADKEEGITSIDIRI